MKSLACVLASLALAGCNSSKGTEQPQAGSVASEKPQGSADCTTQIRFRGVTYSSYGYPDREPSDLFVDADQASCHDTGAKPAGSVFAENPPQVEALAIHGYSSDEVLGVRRMVGKSGESLAVFVADSVPQRERARIFRELAQPAR
jgi:hypothetical protein